MSTLSIYEVKRIRKRIIDEGIESKDLTEELLDHFCTAIEMELANNIPFNIAIENVFAELDENELKLTELRRNELLKGKSLYYPNLLQSFGLMVLFSILFALTLAVRTILNGYPQTHSLTKSPEMAFLVVLVIYGGVIWFAISKIKKSLLHTLSFKRIPNYAYLPLFGILYLMHIWLEGLTWVYSSPSDQIQKINNVMQTWGLGSFIFIQVFAGILYELLLRGIILKGLLQSLTPFKAIFWTSFFGIWMLWFDNPVSLFATNIILCWIYWKTRSLSPLFYMFILSKLSNLYIFHHMQNSGINLELYTWYSLIGNKWAYIAVVISSFGLTLGLMWYLDKRLAKDRLTR